MIIPFIKLFFHTIEYSNKNPTDIWLRVSRFLFEIRIEYLFRKKNIFFSKNVKKSSFVAFKWLAPMTSSTCQRVATRKSVLIHCSCLAAYTKASDETRLQCRSTDDLCLSHSWSQRSYLEQIPSSNRVTRTSFDWRFGSILLREKICAS